MNRLTREWLPEKEMIIISRKDVEFLRMGSPGSPAEEPEDAYFASICFEDGSWDYQWMRFTESGQHIKKMLDESILALYEPIHVKLQYARNYQHSGNSYWMVEFCANDILAWRRALMTCK